MAQLTFYEVIGVAPDANDETIRKALGAHSSQWSKRVSMAASIEKRHEAERMMQVLQEARRALLDRNSRLVYDQGLMEIAASHTGAPDATQAVDDASRMPCPFCLEPILVGAKKCRWCNEWLEARVATHELDPGAQTHATGPLDPLPQKSSTGPLDPELANKRPLVARPTIRYDDYRDEASVARPFQSNQALTVQATQVAPVHLKSAAVTVASKALAPPLRYASGWARFCAVVIDTVLYLLGIGIASAMSPNFGVLMVLSHPLWYVFYEGSSSRGTPGQQSMKLMVISEDGNQIGWGSALARYIGRYFSLACLCLGFLWIFIDPKGQAWHDKLVGSVVVRR